MKRMHVTFEEFEFGGITEEVPLDDIEVGESFICVDTVGSGSKWPVFDRTEAGYVRRATGKVEPHIPEHYKIHKLKE